MDRSNHYERAFESYLQRHGLCYVAVDETRRATDGATSIKSLDFLVFGDEVRLVVDVKGRRFPAGPKKKRRRVWECWSELADVEGLERWATLAGADYQGLLVFGYHLLPEVKLPADLPDLFNYGGRRYLWRAIGVGEYRLHMRTRSPRWQTVNLPQAAYRRLVRPLSHYTRATVPVGFLDEDEVPF